MAGGFLSCHYTFWGRAVLGWSEVDVNLDVFVNGGGSVSSR